MLKASVIIGEDEHGTPRVSVKVNQTGARQKEIAMWRLINISLKMAVAAALGAQIEELQKFGEDGIENDEPKNTLTNN